MSNTLYTLSAEDVLILQGMVEREKTRVRNTQGRTLLDEVPPTGRGQLVAKVPTGGIAARSSLEVSAGDCDIYRLIDGTLEDAGFTRVVYNLDTELVPENSYVLIKQDNWGAWWTDGSPLLDETGTGGGDVGTWSKLTDGIMVNVAQSGHGTKTIYETLSDLNAGWQAASDIAGGYAKIQFDKIIADNSLSSSLTNYSEMFYNGHTIHCPANSGVNRVSTTVGTNLYAIQTVNVGSTPVYAFGIELNNEANSFTLTGSDFFYDAGVVEWDSGTSYVTNDRANVTDGDGIVRQYRATANNTNDLPPSANWVFEGAAPHYAVVVKEGGINVRKHGATGVMLDGSVVVGGIITEIAV